MGRNPAQEFSLREVVFAFDKVADIGVGEDQFPFLGQRNGSYRADGRK